MKESHKEETKRLLEEIPYYKLKTQEESWACDSGCGVDKDEILTFIHAREQALKDKMLELVDGVKVTEIEFTNRKQSMSKKEYLLFELVAKSANDALEEVKNKIKEL